MFIYFFEKSVYQTLRRNHLLPTQTILVMIITRNKNSFLLRLLVKLLHHHKNNKNNGDVLFGDLGVWLWYDQRPECYNCKMTWWYYLEFEQNKNQ